MISRSNSLLYRCVSHTDHKVDNAAEGDGGDGAHDEVRKDLGDEEDRHSVVTTDVLVPVTRRPK